MDHSIGYREVVPDQTYIEKWNEITLNTGGTQSTLQDFKVAEKTGGFYYKDQKKYYTRNRFIYWRVCNDTLELVEQSLDISLVGNRVRYKFTDTPVLDGVSVCEVHGAVFVLVATVSSVHRLHFPHPDVLHNREHMYPRAGIEFTAPSIFSEASANDARNPATFHVINHNNANSPPHTSASGMSAEENYCLFALAYLSGTVLLVRLEVLTGTVLVAELSQHSDALMPRFLSRALRGKSNEDAVPVSLLLQPVDGETLLFSLCRDGNIRAWSTQRHNCCVMTDFPSNPSQGAQSHKLKKAFGPNGELYIGVLHCFSSHSTIQILEPTDDEQKLNVLDIIHIPQGKDVVEFSITGNMEVWAVLRSAAGDTAISVSKNGYWLDCELDTPWDRDEVQVDPDIEPKQAYLNFIFHPGRFPIPIINKALSIYRKANVITDVGVPLQVLKERVSAVVDAQVYGEMREREYSAEELLQIQNSAWQKFYSCVVEYYESGTRPLGLLVISHPNTPTQSYVDNSVLSKSTQDENSMEQDNEEEDDDEDTGEMCTSGVLVIKKSYISLVRPMDNIENIAFNAENTLSSSENSDDEDIARLVSVLAYLDDNLPEDSKLMFEKSLKQLKTPILTVAELFAKDLSFSDEDTMTSLDLINNVALNLEKIKNIDKTMRNLLDLLDVAPPDLDAGLSIDRSKWLLHLGHLYGSQLGMSFVSTSVHQMMIIRYDLCRCLLILEQFAQSNSFQQFLSKPKRIKLPAELLDRTSHLIQCYYLLLWVSQTPIHSFQPLDRMENSVSILKLNEARNPLLATNYSGAKRNMTILHLFLQTTASSTVRLLLSHQEIPTHLIPLWKDSFLPFAHVLTQLIWPKCGNTLFPEFLLFSGQHLHIQEYTRLLSKWCHSNSYTRKFLLACSFLDTGEHNKAFDLFNKASYGVMVDDLIKNRVVRNNEKENRTLVLYYVQVMKLFEQQGLHNLVIELVEKAISVADPNEPELATLYSVAFLHHLELGRYEQAFTALMSNPDGERRKDCLQQLVVTLVDARLLRVLMNFCYDGVRPELERIVEARARSLDVMDNPYYNFAYAYHVQRGTIRKAGCVMYEQALRLTVESSPEALERQCHCYMAAINALSLVKREDQWIIKPLPVLEEAMDTSDIKDYNVHRKVEVLELKDLKKELALCKTRLKLVQFSADQEKTSSLASLNPSELVGVLTNNGLYKDALEIANLWGVSKGSIFSGLTGACVRMDETPNDLAWDWLRENDAADLGDGSAAALAWRLLESLLIKEEAGKESVLHRCIATKLIHLGVFLPFWLISSYKKRNAAELLRLLLSAGRLDEAAELAVEYVSGVLGKGKERFDLDTALLPQHPAVWLPHNTLDLLLLELEAHSTEDVVYKEWHSQLNEIMKKYMETVARVSEDKFKLANEEMLCA